MKRFIVIFFYLVLGTTLYAAIVPDDTTRVTERSFSQEKIDQLRKSHQYNYEKSESWLYKILEFIGKIFKKIFNIDLTPSSSPAVGNIMNIVVIIVAIILLVLLLTRAKFKTWMSGKGAQLQSDYEVENENIHTILFEEEIKQAELEKDYRRAVRLRFLRVLKNLTDAERITWDSNKTNFDYDFEMRQDADHHSFRNAVYVYELVWYGEIDIDESYYQSNIYLFEKFSVSAINYSKKPA